MTRIALVRIGCGHCGSRFAPPLDISDRKSLDEFAAWGGIVDCPACHRFVQVRAERLSYVEDSARGHHLSCQPCA